MSEEIKYIVIGPFCWGRSSDDDEDAYVNCVQNIPHSTSGEVIFTCLRVSKDTRVNLFGGLDYPQGDPAPVRYWERSVPKQFIEEYRLARTNLIEGDHKQEVVTTYFDENGKEGEEL